MEKKVVFLYDAPHYLHEVWADSVGAIKVPYAKGFKNLIFSQIVALFNNVPKADIYIVESLKCALPAIKRKLFNSKVKIICINSDTLFYDYPRYGRIKKELCSIYLGFVDYFISTSKYVKSLAQKYTKIPHIIVYPYVDYDKFSKLNINLKDKNISTIGNKCFFRGTDLLIKSFMKIDDMTNGIMNLVIIGRDVDSMEDDKKLSYNVKNLASYEIYWNLVLKRIRYVTLTGRVQNPEVYLTGNYINVARHDSFGINVLEAMSAGIPPIVSTNVGAKEILPKQLITKLEVDSIVKKYEWLNKSIAQKRILGKICQRIAKKFTKEKSIKQFQEAIKSLTHT